MIFHFQKTLYTKTALLKAAYHFTDQYYVHLESNADAFSVTLKPKDGVKGSLSQNDFQNEILAQTIKEIVSDEAKHLRTVLMARAMSSSMIDTLPKDSEINDEYVERADEILKDWFDHE